MTNYADHSNAARVAVVGGVVILREGQVVLVQESRPDIYGKWNLPGGHIDQGESIEQGAIREAKEECGLDVALDTPLPVMHFSIDQPVFHPFVAHVVGGELKHDPEDMLDVRWFTPAEIRAMKPSLRHADYILSSLEAAGL